MKDICKQHNDKISFLIKRAKRRDNEIDAKRFNKMYYKVNEMHQIFTNTTWTTKTLIKIFAAIGIITGGIIGLRELFK